MKLYCGLCIRVLANFYIQIQICILKDYSLKRRVLKPNLSIRIYANCYKEKAQIFKDKKNQEAFSSFFSCIIFFMQIGYQVFGENYH
jgi:hypothetical protein